MVVLVMEVGELLFKIQFLMEKLQVVSPKQLNKPKEPNKPKKLNDKATNFIGSEGAYYGIVDCRH